MLRASASGSRNRYGCSVVACCFGTILLYQYYARYVPQYLQFNLKNTMFLKTKGVADVELCLSDHRGYSHVLSRWSQEAISNYRVRGGIYF